MFPWVYGFSWTMGNVIFLGLFFTVVAIIGATMVLSLLRTYRDIQAHKAETIRWESEFHDLPVSELRCRHEFTGEFKAMVPRHGVVLVRISPCAPSQR